MIIGADVGKVEIAYAVVLIEIDEHAAIADS